MDNINRQPFLMDLVESYICMSLIRLYKISLHGERYLQENGVPLEEGDVVS